MSNVLKKGKVAVAGVFALLMSVSIFPAGVNAQLPPADTIVSSVSVILDNTSRQDVYDFVTNLENDELWYPGIISTELIETGPNGQLVGTKYRQIADANGLITTTDIEVLAAYDGWLFVIEGDGDLADFTAVYTFRSLSGNRAEYTLSSVYEAPGFTEEVFEQYITFALGQLIPALNTTGSVVVNYLQLFPGVY